MLEIVLRLRPIAAYQGPASWGTTPLKFRRPYGREVGDTQGRCAVVRENHRF